MAYGNGAAKDHDKRMADLGHLVMTAEMTQLRSRCLAAVSDMARAVFPDCIEEPRPSGKEIDALLLPLQVKVRESGLNSVWAEKVRFLAKVSVMEQWKRRQNNLFGRLKNISARGDRPMEDGHLRLLNLTEAWSRALSDADVNAVQAHTEQLDFRAILALVGALRQSDAGFTAHQAAALRSIVMGVEDRYECPEWSDEASIQLHLDARTVRGGAKDLRLALGSLTDGLMQARPVSAPITLTGPVSRGPSIDLAFILSRRVCGLFDDRADQSMTSLAIELGPDKARLRGVVARPQRDLSMLGCQVIIGEDFGFANTSSITALRSKKPVEQKILNFIAEAPGKEKTKEYLESHVSDEADIEILEQWQISGKNFLELIATHAARVDTLRSEIDLNYSRLHRIRKEINAIAGLDPEALVPEAPAPLSVSALQKARYLRMHIRFFRLLKGIHKLKAKRRDVYRKVAAVKKNWLGFVSNVKAKLAEKYNAAVVSEDLTILAIPKDNPNYKGRTFNKMINNGAKGQYIRRSEDKLKWRGIAHIKVPSFYSSTTDWRNATVDRAQRVSSGVFRARDGKEWDADLHASEMLARWLFLKPKSGLTPTL